jgi:hypothetical protein
MANEKLKPEQKTAAMADIGKNFAVIEAARADVTSLEVQAAPGIKSVMASFGPGPHKMPVPQKDGTSLDYIVNFRKDGDRYSVSAVRADSIT